MIMMEQRSLANVKLRMNQAIEALVLPSKKKPILAEERAVTSKGPSKD